METVEAASAPSAVPRREAFPLYQLAEGAGVR
jgi:hypothetical protein